MSNDIAIRLYTKGAAKVKSELNGIRGEFDKLGKSKGGQQFMSGLGMGAGIQAWNALGSAVRGALDWVMDSVTAASDLRESMALTEQVFEGNADAVKAWGETASRAFGASQREALNFASNFGTAFKNVGMSLDETTEKAEEMTRLAADLGSAFNAGSEEAAIALRSGLLGESEPLRRFGVFLDEAKTKAKALEMGFTPLGGKLSDTAKVTARYALIMEQTADSQGMFGRDTESLADAQKELAAEMENLQAEIGTRLMPAFLVLTQTLNDDVIPALEKFIDLIDEANRHKLDPSGIDIGLLSNLVDILTVPMRTPLWRQLDGTYDRYNKLSERIKADGSLFLDLAGWARTTGRGLAVAGRGGDKAAAGIGDAGDEAKDARRHFENLAEAVEDATDALIEASLEPKQLKIELALAKGELSENQKALDKLKGTKNLTRDQRTEMKELKLRVLEGKEEVIRLSSRLAGMGQISTADLRRQLALLGVVTGDTADEAERLLAAMNRLGVKPSTGAGSGGPGKGGRAAGGPVWPGGTYTVGEAGPEKLLMFPGGGGLVVPQPGGGGGGTPVNLAVYLDSDQIAARVERRQYFAASVAPASIR